MRDFISYAKICTLIAVVISIAVLYGCSGGGGGIGNDPINLYSSTIHISGNVTASGSIKTAVNPSILAAVSIADCDIYLEDNSSIKTITNAGGNFDLSPIPPGSHRIIAKYVNTAGQIFKGRSSLISVSESNPDGKSETLDLNLASLKARGILKTAEGQPVINAVINLWGETFTTNSSGEFETPLMPQDSAGTLSIQSAGFQTTSIDLYFNSPNPPYISTVLPKISDTNRAPQVSLRADAYKVTALNSVQLYAVAVDPDNQTLSYSWSSTSGSLSMSTGNLSATWAAPAQAGPATITFQAQDTGGLKTSFAVGITIVSSSGGSGDTTPPTVISVYPSIDAIGTPLNSTIWINFSEAMNDAYLNSTNIYVSADGSTHLAGVISVTTDKTSAAFIPSTNLISGTKYTVTVTTAVRDTTGNCLGTAKVWSFTTTGSGNSSDTTSPTVISVVPTEGATNVSVGTTVGISFSEAMDSSTITTTNINVVNGAINIAGTVSLNADKTTATFTPTSALSNSTVYTVTVAKGVKDLAGNSMTGDKIWNFTTGVAADTTPPTIVSMVPAAGATNVDVGTVVTIVFSEAMDSSTLTPSAINLYNGAVAVAGSVFVSADKKTATLTPSASLAASTLYRVAITNGVKDTAGNMMTGDQSWNFTTAAAVDATPPTVTAISPASGSTDIALSSPISVAFSEAMDTSTINAASFLVSSGSNPISGVITFNTANTVATFTPSLALPAGSIISAGITVAMKDQAGNAIAANASWTFQTRPLNYIPIVQITATGTRVVPSSAINLVASATDADADTLSYAWTATAGNFVSSTGQTVTWNSPATIGDVTVYCRASDGKGGLATASFTIAVNNAVNNAPTLTVSASSSFTANTIGVNVACAANDTNGDPISYSWTAANGSFNNSALSNPIWTPSIDNATYTITCTISDGRGGNANASLQIYVYKTLPSVAGQSASYTIGTSLELAVLTPNKNEKYGLILYPMTTSTGTYRIDVNGGGTALSEIKQPMTNIIADSARNQDAIDRLMRNREKELAEKIRRTKDLRAGQVTEPLQESHAAETVGTVKDFSVYRFSTNDYATRTATLQKLGTYAKIFIDNNSYGGINPANTTDTMLTSLLTSFDSKVYDFVTQNYGPTEDVDTDGKVTILFTPVCNAESVIGFQDPSDLYTGSNSNGRDMFYMHVYDSSDFPSSTDWINRTTLTLVHEFQHLVNYVAHVMDRSGTYETTWLNEGLSVQSQLRYDITFAAEERFQNEYQPHPNRYPIINDDWNLGTGQYGCVGLFLYYIFEQTGTSTIRNMVLTTNTGITNIDNRCSANGGFDTLFKNWGTAMFRAKNAVSGSTIDYRADLQLSNLLISSKKYTDAFSASMYNTSFRFITLNPPTGYTSSYTVVRLRDVNLGQAGVTGIRLP